MKFLFIVLLFIGCTATVDTIPGTYTRKAQNEYGIEYDTLLIEKVNAAPDEFAITRRWKYVHHGADTIYKVQRSFARYQVFEHRLHDAMKGKYYLFDFEAGTISDGEVIYRR